MASEPIKPLELHYTVIQLKRKQISKFEFSTVPCDTSRDFPFQTEATATEGGRFHQLFSSSLVEPAEEDLLNELSGHLHYNFRIQGQSTEGVRQPGQSAVTFRL